MVTKDFVILMNEKILRSKSTQETVEHFAVVIFKSSASTSLYFVAKLQIMLMYRPIYPTGT